MDGTRPQRRHLKMALVGLLVLVTVFVQRTEANEVCRTGCKGTPQTFKYEAGTTYKYDYDGKIEIILSSAEGQSTSTEVKAQVLLSQLADCTQVLRLQNVQILDSKGKKLGAISDIEKPIKINFNDGHIEDSICVEEGDNQNSINVKRAIASIFQVDLKNNYETDVFGRCPTEIASHKEGNILVITKSRGLNKCAFREHVQQDFLAGTFNVHSEIKSSPILNGVYGSKLRVKNGVLEQATVTEDYLYVPFSVGNNGAKAKVTSKLQLTGSGKEAPTGAPSKPRSLIFENPHPLDAPESNAKTVFETVKKASDSIDLVVGEDTAKEFVQLIKTVRHSNKDDLLLVYNQVNTGADLKNKDAARRLYLDALLRSGNAGSVEAAIELLTNKQLDPIEEKVAYLGLNFVRHANEGSLKSALKLLSNPKLPREAFLGIGNLLNRYCTQHSCHDVQAAHQLSNALLSKLEATPKTREQENDVVYALKALGNVRYLSDTVAKKVVAIAQDKKAASRIRVAALETFLADPCKVNNQALSILQDIQQDSEIRIKAYLALAKCPTAKIANSLKTLLEKEPSLQVGGFILSHIRNVRNSADPDKAFAQQHLGGIRVQKKFPIDPRKWSFNSEFSYSVDTLGVGANTESNIIYSQNSWLPRSSSLNLTAEIFGHNFNFLEIETRQENLDKVVEHYLGPKGVLRSALPKNFVENGLNNWNKLAKLVEDKLRSVLNSRSKRDVSKAEMDHIAKQINLRTNELNKDLDLDLSLKVFGAEVAFLNLYSAEKLTPEAIIDRFVTDLAKGLDRLQKFDETIRSNVLFLDGEINYPTSLGFPLKLAVEASATTQLKAQGAVDVRNLIKNPLAGEIKAKIIPSANIEVAGRLTLDALVVENGLRITSSLYTSTGSDISLSYTERGYDFRFGLPVQEQKLMSLSHEIVFHTRDQSGKEDNAPLKFTQVKDWSICVDQLAEFVGLTFCGEVNGPNTGGQVPVLPYPFAGDAKLAVSIENEDVKEYRIQHELRLGQGQQGSDWIFETIGKNGQRKLSVELKGELRPETYLSAVFTSKVKKAEAAIKLVNTNEIKAIQAKAGLDNEAYEIKVGVAVSGSPQKSVYTPILEFKTPQGVQQLPIKVEGQITAHRDGENFKYVFDHVKLDNNVQQVSLNGEIGKDGKGIFTDLEISDQKDHAKIKGRLQVTSDLVKINTEVQNSINPEFNFNIKGEVKRQPNEVDVSLQLIHGADLSSKTNIITYKSKFVKNYKSIQDYKIETKNKFSYPLIAVDAKVDFEQTPNSVEYDVNFQYGELKIGSELEAKVNEKQRGDYQVEFDIRGLDNKIEVKSTRKVLPNDQSKIHNVLQINDKKFELEGKLTHLIRPQNLDIGADLTMKVPNHANPIKVDSGIKVTSEELDMHSKINTGSENVVDAFLKVSKAGDANGNVKVNVKDLLTLQGQVKAKAGAGTADILVDIIGKRQVKAESTFKIQPPKVYDVQVNLYPSFNKDKNLKLTLDTSNRISEEEVITKNKVNILGNPLELNAKVTRQGTPHNGKIDGEVELTLPSEQYFLAKTNTENKEANALLSGQSQGSFEYRKNKNAPGRRVSYKGNWKNTNPKEGLIDASGTVSADDSNGQNINLDVSLARKKEGDISHLTYNHKMYGSFLKNPLQFNMESKYTVTSADYSLKSTHGGNTVEAKGAYDLGSTSKPTSGNLNIQAQSDSKVLKVLKVDLSGSLTRPDKDRKFLIQGAANVYADSADSTIVDVKSQGEIIASPHDGQVKGSLALGKMDPISLSGSYNRKEQNDNREVSGSAALSYGQGKQVKVSGELHKTSDHHYKIKGNLQTPVEGYKNTDFSVETKRQKAEKIDSTAELTVDGQHYKLDTALVLNELAPVIDLKLTCPHGKLKEIYLKGNRASDKHFGGEIRLQDTERDLKLEAGLDVNINSPESFVIKANLNSPTLKVDRAIFEARNKLEGNERKVAVSLKVADKNVVSGHTNYQSRQENGRFIVEGSGNFKVHEESQNGNFKVILEQLTQEKDNEIGSELHFISSIGKRGFDSEFKTSNKHFRVQTSYCEEKKTCANIEIDNKINTNDIHNFNEVLTINADLRKFGLTHEFGVKQEVKRKDYVIDYTLDAHLENDDKSKYQFSVALHPKEKNGHVTLHTPKRVISLEGKANYPEHLTKGGNADGEIAFYIDKKNHADKKTALTWLVNVDPQAGKIHGETKLNHPGLNKPLLVSFTATRTGTPYNGELQIQAEADVFAQANQKLVSRYYQKININDAKTVGESKIALDIKSQGLKIDISMAENIKADRNTKTISYEDTLKYHVGSSKYDNIASLTVSPTKLEALLKLWNTVLVKAHNKVSAKDNEQIIETEVGSYDNNPLVGRLEIKNYNQLFYSLGFKKTPNAKLQLNAALIPGQIADARVDHLNGNEKHNLFHATLNLDEANFLKPDYNVDAKEIEKVLKVSKDHQAQFVDGLEKLAKEWVEDARKESQHFGELAKKAAPNLNPVKNYYVKEFKEIKDEILSDKSIKELGEAVRKVLSAIFETGTEIFEKINHVVDELSGIIEKSFATILNSFEKELLPQLKEISSRLTAVARDILNSVSEIVLGVVSKALKIAEQYQPELKELAATLGELSQDWGRFVQDVYANLRESILSLWQRINEELKASPIFEELKQYYEHFIKEGMPNADAILNTVTEVFNSIKDVIPPDFFVRNEIVEFLDTITDYADKKLHGKPVDDIAVLEKLGKTITVIVRKLATLVSFDEYGAIAGLPDHSKLPGQLPINYLKNLPSIVAAKFSPLNFIIKEDISREVIELLLSLVNRPRNLFAPFPLFGMVIQGQHIFTFGGKHFTFPGNCNYLLARDAINGNFTLVGSYKDGLLQAITLADPTDSITLNKGGQVKLNKVVVDLPTRKPNLAAYRTYGTVNLVSTAGVFVVCEPDLIGCEVHISGFYHGQIRGLLGVGNNEPYDDFTLPNGKITTSENDFANAYKTKTTCADVKVNQDHAASNPNCNKLFSWESSLRYCYPFVNPHHFKEACAHGLANGVKHTELAIAQAYVSACHERNIPISTPEELLKCENSAKPHNVGDQFSVKLPSKSADIVLLVDTLKENEEIYKQLVQPLVQDVGEELRAKGVNDVEFHLITYGGENLWPSHVTFKGKMTFKGKAPNVKFSEQQKNEEDEVLQQFLQQFPPDSKAIKFGEALKSLMSDVTLVTGHNLRAHTYQEGLKYPFRADALKSILVFSSKPCEVGRFYPLQKLTALFYKDDLFTLNLFTPFTNLQVKDTKKSKDVYGFNSNTVFTRDAKNNAELHKELNYDDYCVDFVVHNGGNVFSNTNFLENKNEQKQFVKTAASKVVDQLVSTEQGLDCECKMDSPWSARNVCSSVFSKERSPKKV